MWVLDLGATNRGLVLWDEQRQYPRRWPAPALGSGRQGLTLDDLMPGLLPAETESDAWRATLMSVADLDRARKTALSCMKEWLKVVRLESKLRLEHLVVVLPNLAAERSRTELTRLFGKLGVSVRFVNEAVAAALGYELEFERPRRVLVAAFGERRLELSVSVLRSDERGVFGQPLARAGSAIGTDQVDLWLLSDLYRTHGYLPLDLSEADAPSWGTLMLEETRRVRLRALERGSAAFDLMPPEELRDFSARLQGEAPLFELARAQISDALDASYYAN